MNEISRIETAHEQDAFDIALINALSWKKAYSGIIPEKILDNISVDRWSEGWKHQLRNNNLILVLFIQNIIMGFSQLCKNQLINPVQGELNAIYLHPVIWGKGYGKELYLSSLEEIKKLGHQEIVIWVLSKNQIARKFYKSLGFEESGQSRNCPWFPNYLLDEIQYINRIG